MTYATRVLQALAILTLVAGCSGAKTESSSPYRTEESFCTRWAQAACNATVVSNCGATDTDSCVASQSSFCTSLIASDKYASKYASACISAVKAAYKDAQLDGDEYALARKLGGACAKVVSGDGGQDAPCTATTDCDTLSGLDCVTPPGGSGTCQTPEVVANGDPCGQAQQVCNPGHYCSGPSGNCIANAGQGAECSTDVPCADGLKCADTGTGTTTCMPKTANNEVCANDDACVSGICTIPTGQVTGLCSAKDILTNTDAICKDLR